MKGGLFHRIVISVLFLLSYLTLQAETIEEQEKSIASLFSQIMETQSDSLRKVLNIQLQREVENVLKEESTFEYPFTTLNYLGKIYSDDHLVRVYTWSIPLEDKTYLYGGVIQHKTKKGVVTLPLRIKNEAYVPTAGRNVSLQDWYGALYYKVAKVKKKRDIYYIALGWSGNNAATDFKVVETWKFSNDGKLPYMGMPVFIDGQKRKLSRIILQYNSSGKVTLDYQPQSKQIIFDHLMPIEPCYKGIYSYYGPDFTYDAYVEKKGEWTLEENIDARNK